MEFHYSNNYAQSNQTKMKAARYYGPGKVKLDQVPEPQAKEGQVKIKVYTSALDILYFYISLTPVPDCLVFFQFPSRLADVSLASHVVTSSTFRNGSRWLVINIFTNLLSPQQFVGVICIRI